jgi:plasmid stabilization system protein ParE
MRVIWAAAALTDLDQAFAYTRQHFPQSLVPFERRVRATVERIELWPENARRIDDREGVRVVPLIRYPYRIFYRVSADQIEILHIHHVARLPRDM